MTVPQQDRTPYVGAGEDGCRRSAKIDQDEAKKLSYFDERREALLASAQQWEDQGYRLLLERVGERPSLEQLRTDVGSEEWLAALALLDLSPALATDAAQWTEWARHDGRYTSEGQGEDQVSTFHPSALMDWEGWVARVEDRGRGWSSTEHRLFQIIAALVTDRPMALRGIVDSLGSWRAQVLQVLVQWASGGNNRDRPGQLTVTDAAGYR